MLIYLLKTSLVWLLMLVLYKLLYARSKRYLANRAYLIATIIIGALLPLVSLHIPDFDYLQPVTALRPANAAMVPAMASVSPEATRAGSAFNPEYLLWWIYSIGIGVLLVLMIREIITIIRYAVYGHQKRVGPFKVFKTGKQHQPFSFMGWIFIGGKENYTDEQLDYIVRHEDAHNRRRHWLDILIMQIVVMVFWFHPLIWCIRYHLKMQHEYEADSIASGNNSYGYGRFLLQAAVQNSVPLISHSFFYSPIKNRITMLTKTRKKLNIWRYAAIIPVLAGCLVFLSSATNNSLERVRVGDKTTFKGNDFYWKKGKSDTIMIQDPVSGKQKQMIMLSSEMIYRMNNEDVIPVNDLSVKPQFSNDSMDFEHYIGSNLRALINEFPDSIESVELTNIVIDRKGKIVYYDVIYRPYDKDTIAPELFNNKRLDPLIDKFMNNGIKLNAGIKDGNSVNAVFDKGVLLSKKPTSIRVQLQGLTK